MVSDTRVSRDVFEHLSLLTTTTHDNNDNLGL